MYKGLIYQDCINKKHWAVLKILYIKILYKQIEIRSAFVIIYFPSVCSLQELVLCSN